MTEPAIRICAMIAVRDGLRSWGTATRELIDAVAAPDVEVTMRDLPGAPLVSIMTGEDCDLVAPYNIAAALRAERDGFDAFTTGCLLDPGILAMRDRARRLVVVGDCQAVMHMGSLLGQRISFLLPNREAAGCNPHPTLLACIAQYGLSQKLASIRTVKGTSLDFAADEDDLPARMLEQGKLAVAEDGADVIVGYGSLRVIEHLRDRLPVPVLESVQCTISLATELVRHRRRRPAGSNLASASALSLASSSATGAGSATASASVSTSAAGGG